MNPLLFENPVLKHYNFDNFNGRALYEKEIQNIGKPDGPHEHNGNEICWRDNKGNFHREHGPALIRPQGNCKWIHHGFEHNINNPSSIGNKNRSIEWKQNNQYHRIGAFAFFDKFLNLYHLYINGEKFLTPENYVKAAKDWLLKHESAHQYLEDSEKLDESLRLGHLCHKNWKDGIFLRS